MFILQMRKLGPIQVEGHMEPGLALASWVGTQSLVLLCWIILQDLLSCPQHLSTPTVELKNALDVKI